jgi:hypothetical protein
MRGRIARAAVVVAMVGAVFAVQGVQVSGADDGDDPVGYSIGSIQHGAGALGGCNFYKIDLKTGAATQLNVGNGSVKCGDGLTYDDDGTLYAYTQRVIAGVGPTVSELVTIDKHTGVQHVVGQLPNVLVGGGGMTFDADGDLWLYGVTINDPRCTPNASTCLWKVNPKTAASTFVGTAPTGRAVYGLTGDCEDVWAISADTVSGPGVSLHTELDEVDTHSAALHKITDVPGIAFPTGLDFDADDDLWALANSFTRGAGTGMILFRVDPRNGNTGPTDITFNGAPFSGQLNGLAVSPISCDDPGPDPTPAPPAPVVAAEPLFTG